MDDDGRVSGTEREHRYPSIQRPWERCVLLMDIIHPEPVMNLHAPISIPILTSSHRIFLPRETAAIES